MQAFQPIVLAPLQPLPEFRYRIVHELPGRVRIIHEKGEPDHGLRFARRLAAHPDVRRVRLSTAARSLTVDFNPLSSFGRIIDHLPEERDLPAPITVIEPGRTRVAGLASLAMELVSGNPIAIALALLSPLLNRPALIS